MYNIDDEAANITEKYQQQNERKIACMYPVLNGDDTVRHFHHTFHRLP